MVDLDSIPGDTPCQYVSDWTIELTFDNLHTMTRDTLHINISEYLLLNMKFTSCNGYKCRRSIDATPENWCTACHGDERMSGTKERFFENIVATCGKYRCFHPWEMGYTLIKSVNLPEDRFEPQLDALAEKLLEAKCEFRALQKLYTARFGLVYENPYSDSDSDSDRESEPAPAPEEVPPPLPPYPDV